MSSGPDAKKPYLIGTAFAIGIGTALFAPENIRIVCSLFSCFVPFAVGMIALNREKKRR